MTTSMAEEMKSGRELGTQPIRADAPSGDSVRYDPDFERLQAEMLKLDSVSNQPVAWAETVRLAHAILQGKSKDLLVASYLCRGSFEQRGYVGLAGGLACVDGMIAERWDSLYPEATRLRARINAVAWLAEQVGGAVARRPPRGEDRDALSACERLVQSIERALDERLGADAPGLGDLRRGVDGHLRAVSSEEAAPSASPSAAAAAPASAGAGAAAIRTEIGSLDDCQTVLRNAGDLIRRAAEFARGQDPSLPWPYRLARTLAWMDLETLPAHAEGETRVPPPPTHLREQFESLMDRKAWLEVVAHAEALIQESPFWLDPHRFVASSLSKLGPTYEGARGAVTAEVLTLVRRIPDVIECRFSDGTPFADDETKRWIHAEMGPSAQGAAGSTRSAASTSADGNALAEAKARVSALMGAGEPREAIEVFQQAVRTVSSPRERFLLRFELAQLCVEAGHPKAALSQLEALDAEITRHGLDEWEPDLSLDVWLATWRVVNRLLRDTDQPSPEWRSVANAVYARLARVDVLSAVDLEKR